MAIETIDLSPTPEGYATVGAMLLADVVNHKVQPTDRFAAAQMLTSVIDIVRYLATLDAKEGSAHLALLLKRAALFPVPPVVLCERSTFTRPCKLGFGHDGACQLEDRTDD